MLSYLCCRIYSIFRVSKERQNVIIINYSDNNLSLSFIIGFSFLPGTCFDSQNVFILKIAYNDNIDNINAIND